MRVNVGNINWFRRIPKVQVDSRVGPIWAPNFYYRARIVQANLSLRSTVRQ